MHKRLPAALFCVLTCAAVLLLGAQAAPDPAALPHDPATHQAAPLLGTLGSFTRPIGTSSAQA